MKEVSPTHKRIALHIQRGFSLGEVMLASFVLTIGIITVVKLVADSYRSSENTQDAIIAAELAQEGVELVRNIRDNNIAYRVDHWSTAEDCEHTTSGACDPFQDFDAGNNQRARIDFSTGSLDYGSSASNPALNLHNGFYQHTGAATGPFYRIIKTWNSGGANPTVRVQSIVTWQDPGSSYNGGSSHENCEISNKCVYTELLLTAWK